MKRKLIAAIAVFAVCLPVAVFAVKKAAPPAETFQLVALLPFDLRTTGKISSDEWQQCRNVLGGRPANTKDVISLSWDPASFVFEGWVNPYIVAADPVAETVVDISGVRGAVEDLTCRDTQIGVPWFLDDQFHRGLRASANAVMLSTCSFSLPIVCVVPIPAAP